MHLWCHRRCLGVLSSRRCAAARVLSAAAALFIVSSSLCLLLVQPWRFFASPHLFEPCNRSFLFPHRLLCRLFQTAIAVYSAVTCIGASRRTSGNRLLFQATLWLRSCFHFVSSRLTKECVIQRQHLFASEFCFLPLLSARALHVSLQRVALGDLSKSEPSVNVSIRTARRS